jgi:hypothetical protein
MAGIITIKKQKNKKGRDTYKKVTVTLKARIR